MKNITMSDQAYDEFKSFLDENKVTSYDIRINLAGYGCSGPAFNISVSKKQDDDICETVKDVTFLIDKSLIEEFGGFIIVSSEENNDMGLSLRPVIKPEGGCSHCGGGCH